MLSLGKVASPSNLYFDKRVQPPSVVWLSSLCLFLQVFLFEFRSFVTSTRLDILITLSRSQYIGESILCTSRQPSGRRLRGVWELQALLSQSSDLSIRTSRDGLIYS